MKLFGTSSFAAKAKWPVSSSPDRSDNSRVLVALSAVGSSVNGLQYQATTIEISVDGASFLCDHRPVVGDHIALEIARLGFFRGTVVDLSLEGFSLRFFERPCTTISLKDRLAALVIQDQGEEFFKERRGAERLKPVNRLVWLRTGKAEGIVRVKNLSRSGVAFNTTIEVRTGDVLQIGQRRGIVVRTFENGAAMAFLKPIDEAVFNAGLVL